MEAGEIQGQEAAVMYIPDVLQDKGFHAGRQLRRRRKIKHHVPIEKLVINISGLHQYAPLLLVIVIPSAPHVIQIVPVVLQAVVEPAPREASTQKISPLIWLGIQRKGKR